MTRTVFYVSPRGDTRVLKSAVFLRGPPLEYCGGLESFLNKHLWEDNIGEINKWPESMVEINSLSFHPLCEIKQIDQRKTTAPPPCLMMAPNHGIMLSALKMAVNQRKWRPFFYFDLGVTSHNLS